MITIPAPILAQLNEETIAQAEGVNFRVAENVAIERRADKIVGGKD